MSSLIDLELNHADVESKNSGCQWQAGPLGWLIHEVCCCHWSSTGVIRKTSVSRLDKKNYISTGKKKHHPSIKRNIEANKKKNKTLATPISWLVVSTHLKNMKVKLGIFPKKGWKYKIFEATHILVSSIFFWRFFFFGSKNLQRLQLFKKNDENPQTLAAEKPKKGRIRNWQATP